VNGGQAEDLELPLARGGGDLGGVAHLLVQQGASDGRGGGNLTLGYIRFLAGHQFVLDFLFLCGIVNLHLGPQACLVLGDVAHVDHGKSTLSDRLLELTGTIQPGANKQVLDKLDVERERGITVKAQTCSMIYNYKGLDYLLHLVDTPGHVDFRAEVARSYASCGGALLLVDASQGIQAQTVANFYQAFAQGLTLIPVINKVDLPHADPPRALQQMKDSFELDPDSAVAVSAKTGLNVESILPVVIENIPAWVYNPFLFSIKLLISCLGQLEMTRPR